MNENVFNDPQNWEGIRLVDIVDPGRRREEEQREERRIPFRVRHSRNLIELFEGEYEELVSRRGVVLKELEKERIRTEFLENELSAIAERMQAIERKVREAYGVIEEEGKSL
jgi:hypothetical protein